MNAMLLYLVLSLGRPVMPADLHRADARIAFSEGRYRESIASLELALLNGSTRPCDDAQDIATAYARLGNTKQAGRWRGHAADCRETSNAMPGDGRTRNHSKVRFRIPGVSSSNALTAVRRS